MPLILIREINEATKIGVWHITEKEEFFLDHVPIQRSITHPHKRLQHLAGRYLLRELYADFPLSLIEIADTRKPFLADEAYHFSISHCGDYAAAIVSTKNRVGVDIEVSNPKIENLQHKFLSPAEYCLLKASDGDEHTKLTMAWSIKEAIFKWYGSGEVDFINHIHLEKINSFNAGTIVFCNFLKSPFSSLQVRSEMIAGNNLCWLIT